MASQGPGDGYRRIKTEVRMKKVKKVVVAYSGGLDTSVIVKWLKDVYDCES